MYILIRDSKNKALQNLFCRWKEGAPHYKRLKSSIVQGIDCPNVIVFEESQRVHRHICHYLAKYPDNLWFFKGDMVTLQELARKALEEANNSYMVPTSN